MSTPAGTIPLSGWGRYPVAQCRLVDLRRVGDAGAEIAAAETAIARGAGRSYGDPSLNPELTLRTLQMDRVLDFDAETGDLECEAGLLLADLIALFLPRGWFVPVTPGTKFVTLGGMVASDVHGKNHHLAGSFCDHVEWLDLILADGRVERCSRQRNAELFAATCGGMGLTGIIGRLRFRMLRVESASVRQKTVAAPNLDAAMEAIESSLDWTYSVAWIDCLARGKNLGRSLLFLGEHVKAGDLPAARRASPLELRPRRAKTVPIDFPQFALGTLSVRAFNAFYYRAHASGEAVVDLDPYFYPLDAIGAWNRIYGRRGFVQFQCVLPLETSREGMKQLLETISSAGKGSFLAVLKRMGAESFGLLSFPRAGYTLALDFPVGADTFALLGRLNAIASERGGRVYLAKDACATPGIMESGYPRLAQFRAVRRQWDPAHRFSSLQSRRLEL